MKHTYDLLRSLDDARREVCGEPIGETGVELVEFAVADAGALESTGGGGHENQWDDASGSQSACAHQCPVLVWTGDPLLGLVIGWARGAHECLLFRISRFCDAHSGGAWFELTGVFLPDGEALEFDSVLEAQGAAARAFKEWLRKCGLGSRGGAGARRNGEERGA